VLTHQLIDPAINDTLRIVTGCLHPTPADNLPILAGTQPAELHRKGAPHSLARRVMAPGHLLHCSPVYRVGMHGVSNRHTHLYPPPGLLDSPFLGQISEIWPRFKLVGLKNFSWIFGLFLASSQVGLFGLFSRNRFL